ncbi:MAG TPA: hypothetical protein VES42_04985 [Pilimelia sp.]|nr:hypothetical protein [Pilimelia sp.]
MLPRPDADLLALLAAAPGLYRGPGDGPDGGPFLARMRVTPVVRGRAVTLDYEATNDRDGLRHLEHTVLLAGEDGRLELHVACLTLPGMARFAEAEPGVFRAHDPTLGARIVIGVPQPERLTYAWWWPYGEAAPQAQSRADLRRTQ